VAEIQSGTGFRGEAHERGQQRERDETREMNDLHKIVRQRMQAVVAGDHPDPDLLTAFAEQALPERERTPVLEHLARCADCRDVLALASVPAGSAATQIKDTAIARKAPWFSLPVLRWGALAACLVIVGTAVLMYRDEKLAYKDLRQAPPPSASASANNAGDANAPDSSPQETKSKTLLDQEVSTGVPSPVPMPPNVSPEKRLTSRIPIPKQLDAAGLKPATPPVSGANALLAKNLRDDRQMGAAHSTLAGGMAGGIAPPPPAPAAAREKAAGPEKKDVPAPQPPQVDNYTAQANEPVMQMVDATSADSDKSDKKVDVPGRAKTSGAATTALAVAPSDELNMQKSITPATAEVAKARKERGAFSRAAGLLWNISSDGQLQRSADSGKSWQPISVAEGAIFRALTFNGPDIWVGGAAGSLYHSPEAGAHWVQVKPTANGVSLSGDISAIAFTDPQRGKITTTNGQTWITGDGGKSWSQQP